MTYEKEVMCSYGYIQGGMSALKEVYMVVREDNTIDIYKSKKVGRKLL